VLDDCPEGTVITYSQGHSARTIRLVQDTPMGHKFAISEIPAGADVVKFGESIGRATADISPGEHVHVHNVESRRGCGCPGE
jgi:altronate dehydratase small subunit